jgi:hypothetical protein
MQFTLKVTKEAEENLLSVLFFYRNHILGLTVIKQIKAREGLLLKHSR